MEKSVVNSSSHFQFIEQKGANTVTVIFAARNDRPPKFTFWKAGNSLNSHIIFLNSDVPQWYRTGIPGIPGGIRGAVKSILNFKSDVNANRLVMTGSSMGAYGALLFGSMAKADEVLAFGVEPILGVPGGKTDITRNNYQYIYPDLTSLHLPPTTVYYGGMDINDIFGAWLLHKRKRAKILCVPESQHDTPDFLSRKDRLTTVFNDLVTGNPISNFEYLAGDAGNDKIVNFLWSINNSFVEKNWSDIGARIKENQSLLEVSPLIQYLHGISLFRGSDFNNARISLENLTDRTPGYWEAWMNLGAVNLKLGNFENAITASFNAIKLRPHRSIAHIQLSHVYTKAGMHELAFDHAEWACKLNYSRPEYFENLNKLASIVNRPVPDKHYFEANYTSHVKAAQAKYADYDLSLN